MLFVGSLLFVLIALKMKGNISPVLFWMTVVFFGCGAILFLIRLLNPNNIFIPDSPFVNRELLEKQFEKVIDDFGDFTYTDESFVIKIASDNRSYKWGDIQTIFGYKLDLMTTDEICIDVFINNETCLTLTESTPGWHRFNKALSENIPFINSNWDSEIAVPAFETKLTLLFDNNGRTQAEAEAYWYKNK